MEKRTEILRHNFTQEELAEISSEMARGVTDLNTAENEKKAVMSDYKSRIDALTAQVKNLAGKIQSGYEMRPTPCHVEKDFKTGEIRVIRNDTGDLVRMRLMTDADREVDLPGMPPDAPDFCENTECINHDFNVNRCKIGLIYDSEGCQECLQETAQGPQDEDQEDSKGQEDPEEVQEASGGPQGPCSQVDCKKYDQSFDDHCFISGIPGTDSCKYEKTGLADND